MNKRVAAEANIMKQEKEAEVKSAIKVREQNWIPTSATSWSWKICPSTSCRNGVIERQRKAEAELFEHKKPEAKAHSKQICPIARGRSYWRLKVDAGLKAIRQAEAKPEFRPKAEAMKKMQNIITEMVVDKLPIACCRRGRNQGG